MAVPSSCDEAPETTLYLLRQISKTLVVGLSQHPTLGVNECLNYQAYDKPLISEGVGLQCLFGRYFPSSRDCLACSSP